MKICGIICEFNPLHNGHEHLIQTAKKQYDYVLCLMSGNFTQRGKPACLDKFERAKLAISAGADIVIEFPTIFAVNGADEFAKHAIKILSQLGCDSIMFGSESNDKHNLEKLAELKLAESKIFKRSLKKHLGQGKNYSQAHLLAMSDITHDKTLIKLASSPNDILASCYIKEIKKQKSPLRYNVIKRLDNGYGSKTNNGKYLSASSILELKNNNQSYESFVPSFTLEAFKHSPSFDYEKYYSLLQYKISSLREKELSKTFGTSEGLENKIKKEIMFSGDYAQLLARLESKRYRKPRIEKFLFYILLGITKSHYKKMSKTNAPLKVLGVNTLVKNNVLSLLTKSKTKLIMQNKDTNKLTKKQALILSYDQKATDIFSICTNDLLNKDFKTGLQTIKPQT